MEPKFERNERQEKCYKKAVAHFKGIVFFHIVCVWLGIIITDDIEWGFIVGMLSAVFLSIPWQAVAQGYYDDSKILMIGDKDPRKNDLNKTMENDNAQNERFHS